MPDKLRIPPIGSEFLIQEYADTAAKATGHTRTVIVILTVACVVIFVGFWNSLHSSWAAERVRAAYGENINIFNVLESDRYHPTEAERLNYRESLRDEVLKAYINNTRFIKIPFFEIAIDINDLGLMGGGALIIIMLLLTFCLSREITNLNLSFREAFYHEELKTFYHALAMREVFTVPEISGEKRRNPVLVFTPKLLCLLPPTILTLTAMYDYYSIFLHGIYVFTDISNILFFQTSVLVPLLWWVSLTCLEKQFQIDGIWADFWEIIKARKTAKTLLRKNSQKSPELVEILDRRLYEIEENKSLLTRIWNHIKRYAKTKKIHDIGQQENLMNIGEKAPDFTLKDGDGNDWNLSDHLGKTVVLLFYPGDNTPVCTKQLCSVRDHWSDYQATGAEVVGISMDTAESHKGFAEKHELPLTLLSDDKGEVTVKYDLKSWLPGRSARGVVVIDKAGKIAYHKVQAVSLFKPSDEEVLEAIKRAG